MLYGKLGGAVTWPLIARAHAAPAVNVGDVAKERAALAERSD
jgi:hypothetical protein